MGSEEEGGGIKISIEVYLGVDCDILSCSFAHHQCYNTCTCCLRLVLFPGSLLKDMGREAGNKASLKMVNILHFTVTCCLYIPTGDRVSYNACVWSEALKTHKSKILPGLEHHALRCFF